MPYILNDKLYNQLIEYLAIDCTTNADARLLMTKLQSPGTTEYIQNNHLKQMLLNKPKEHYRDYQSEDD